MKIKKEWVKIDAWRGYYKPVAPEGWDLLLDCSIVNSAGETLAEIVGNYLDKQGIEYKSGCLETSNVFSTHFYILVEAGTVDKDLRAEIEDWYVDYNSRTFSIISGKTYDLDVESAKRDFNNLVK